MYDAPSFFDGPTLLFATSTTWVSSSHPPSCFVVQCSQCAAVLLAWRAWVRGGGMQPWLPPPDPSHLCNEHHDKEQYIKRLVQANHKIQSFPSWNDDNYNCDRFWDSVHCSVFPRTTLIVFHVLISDHDDERGHPDRGPPRARSNLCRGHFSAQAHHAPASAEKTCPKAKGGPGWKTDEEESRRGTALGQLSTAIHFAIEHGQNHRQAEPAAAYSLPSIATTPQTCCCRCSVFGHS